MIPFIAAVMATIQGLRRRCPRCRREQIVPPSKKHLTVVCDFCGSEIPPRGSKAAVA